jgi:hypothetical protein
MENFTLQIGPCNFLILRFSPWEVPIPFLLCFSSPSALSVPCRLFLPFLHWQPHLVFSASFSPLSPQLKQAGPSGRVARGASCSSKRSAEAGGGSARGWAQAARKRRGGRRPQAARGAREALVVQATGARVSGPRRQLGAARRRARAAAARRAGSAEWQAQERAKARWRGRCAAQASGRGSWRGSRRWAWSKPNGRRVQGQSGSHSRQQAAQARGKRWNRSNRRRGAGKLRARGWSSACAVERPSGS